MIEIRQRSTQRLVDAWQVAGFRFACPFSLARLEPHSLIATYQADGTAGTRAIAVQYYSPEDVLLASIEITTCIAAATVEITITEMLGAVVVGSVAKPAGPMPTRALLPGEYLRFRDLSGISSGDVIQGVSIVFDQVY